MARPQLPYLTVSDQDFHQLLVPTPTEENSRPRGNTSGSSDPASDASSYFVPEPLTRTNSVYSFSKASLSSQLAGLTSMSLPQAESLAATITALPTARKACRALSSAAEQINSWNRKALRVLKDLDAEDDVEWAAAAGRDALEETDKTINRFENLVNVYVLSIEELQIRRDVSDLRSEELTAVVEQMEFVLLGWDDVRKSLRKVHDQVEIALEWEELWNTILGEVGSELDSLSQLVFEMEEKRHMAFMMPAKEEPDRKINLNELESFIEEPGKKRQPMNPRFSMTFESSPLGSPAVENPQDDSNLLALFARMQPLRASLDFLPMRFSMFCNRAEKPFPSACQELRDKRDRLEKNWHQLSDEAERLRRELSEDRWVIVFRNAGRQAQKMVESVERSVTKVQDAIDAGYQRSNPAALAKRVEGFEAKKMHYLPAIGRVQSIIQKGLKDRLTVNGEILRLNRDLSARMRELTDNIDVLANVLEPMTAKTNSRLRESISSIVSADRSLSSGTFAGTPGSSPASSIDVPSGGTLQKPSPRYGLNGYTKPRGVSRPPPIASNNRRTSLQPQPKRPTTPMSARSVTSVPRRAQSPATASVYQQGSYAPPTASLPARSVPATNTKPRWSAVVKSNDPETAANRRTSRITPSSYYQIQPRAVSSSAALPFRSPLGQRIASSPTPVPSTTVSHRRSSSHLRSFAERVRSPSPAPSLLGPLPYHRSRDPTAPLAGTIRSPSSVAVHSQHKPTMTSASGGEDGRRGSGLTQPPSSLRNSRTPSTLPARSQSAMQTQRHAHPQFYPQLHPQSSSPMMRTPPRKSGDSTVTDPEGSLPSNHYSQPQSQSPSRSHSHYSDNKIDESESEDEEGRDKPIDLGSSPLSRRTATRPPSSAAGHRGGRRISMLPVPVGSGRTSSLGIRS